MNSANATGGPPLENILALTKPWQLGTIVRKGEGWKRRKDGEGAEERKGREGDTNICNK